MRRAFQVVIAAAFIAWLVPLVGRALGMGLGATGACVAITAIVVGAVWQHRSGAKMDEEQVIRSDGQSISILVTLRKGKTGQIVIQGQAREFDALYIDTRGEMPEINAYLAKDGPPPKEFPNEFRG